MSAKRWWSKFAHARESYRRDLWRVTRSCSPPALMCDGCGPTSDWSWQGARGALHTIRGGRDPAAQRLYSGARPDHKKN